jgi:hypothetical protein
MSTRTVNFSDLTPRGSLLPTPQTSPVSTVAQNALQKGNADFTLTPGRSFIYCLIDGVGGLRQTAAATEAFSKIFPVLSMATGPAAVAILFGLLFTGLFTMATAAAWTIPDANKALTAANKELAEAQPGAVDEAKQAVEIAQLGLANHSLYFSMGAAQVVSGITGLFSGSAAQILHYAPLLTGISATVTNLIAGVALGGIYVVRGCVMVTKAIKSYLIAGHFHEELIGADDRLQFMAEAEKKGSSYMDRRVDSSCLVENSRTYTADGFKDEKGNITPYSAQEKKDYLLRVDKGVFTEQLKHKIAIVIAVAMIVGGILAIVVSAATGGLPLIIIALASAIFFMSMEYIFMTYDSSSLFEGLRDRLYTANSAFLPHDKSIKSDYADPEFAQMLRAGIFLHSFFNI